MKRKNFFDRLLLLDAELEKKEDCEEFRKKTLKKLNNFVLEGSYTNYNKKKNLLKIVNRSNEYIAIKLGISVAGVHQIKKRLSDILYASIGTDFYDVVLNGTERQCNSLEQTLQILREVHRSEDVVIPYIVKSLKQSFLGNFELPYDLNECKTELVFLSLYSNARFTDLVNKIDLDKMNYLLSLLDGKEKQKGVDRNVVLKFLEHKGIEKEIYQLLKEKE